MKINRLAIDSTHSVTDLCTMGEKYQTDKSPYNKNPYLHKHAYTAIYDLLFSNLRYSDINIAEIGILHNKSMLCWREYFKNAKLYGFEWSAEYIQKAVNDNLANTSYHFMNIKEEEAIEEALADVGKKYHIVIEDSTHEFADQIRFLKIIYKYMLPGSIVVVEDIFRAVEEELYRDALKPIEKYFSSATFVMAEHVNKYSPGWNNDKLLILHRNDVP